MVSPGDIINTFFCYSQKIDYEIHNIYWNFWKYWT